MMSKIMVICRNIRSSFGVPEVGSRCNRKCPSPSEEQKLTAFSCSVAVNKYRDRPENQHLKNCHLSSAEMSAAVPNHRRTKPGAIKPGAASSDVTGPTSQIPGLSQSATESAPAERVSGRRVGIFESDSDYVKLAKGGGHKGLLSHDVDEMDDAPKKSYQPANWFGDEDSKSGSKATSPDSQMKGGRQPLTAPFGTDNGSPWENSDRYSPNKEKMSPDGVSSPMEQLSLTNKYKRTSYEKKAPPVSMSKLLSHGYMEDKKKSPNDDDTSSVTSDQTSTIATEDGDDLE